MIILEDVITIGKQCLDNFEVDTKMSKYSYNIATPCRAASYYQVLSNQSDPGFVIEASLSFLHIIRIIFVFS